MVGAVYDLIGITKSFGEKVAVDEVGLHVAAGRVLAIVGENGAGKSTLMNVLAGMVRPDRGSVLRNGVKIDLGSPLRAGEHGIAMVHQHLRLVRSLTVAENVFLGREIAGRSGGLRRREMSDQVRELTERLGITVDPDARVADLPIGVKQRVALLRALALPTDVLILDEPTAVLTPQESSELFATVRHLATQGTSTILITHKLGEIAEVADDLAVMRDGRVVAERPLGNLEETEIARLMVGRDVLLRVQNDGGSPAEPRLSLESVTVVTGEGVRALDQVSLTVHAGEVVGIAGVEGNGQSELADVIVGTRRPLSGRITVRGADVTDASPHRRRRIGISSIPEDRNHTGTAPTMMVWENMISPVSGAEFTRGGWIRAGALKRRARELIRRFDIRGAVPVTTIGDLSGGNAQKVVIAREFDGRSDVLLASQPTRGVDVGAMEFIHRSLLDRRDAGIGVLLISADLNEVTSLSDRIMVLYRGRVVAEFTRGNFDQAQIGLAMAGLHNRTAPPTAETDTQNHTPPRTVESDAGDSSLMREADRLPIPPGPPTITPGSIWSQIRRRLSGASSVLVSLAAALLLGTVIILITGRNPVSSFVALFLGSFQSPFGIASLLVQLAPLLVLAVSVLLSFRAGLFNVGGEGQIYIGAFLAAWAASSSVDLPGPVLIIASMLAGVVGGVIWAVVPAVLRAYLDVDEVVSTLMFNYIAIQLTLLLVGGAFKDPTAGAPMGVRIAPQAYLPGLPGLPGATIAVLIAIVIVVIGALLLLRTSFGLGIRRVGEQPAFAAAIGTDVRRTIVNVMLVSGAVAGVAGALDVLGNTHRFSQLFSPEFGFLAVTIALLARLNPWMLLVAGVFYANMLAGANVMQIQADVPFSLVTVLQGVIVIGMTMTIVRVRPRANRRDPRQHTRSDARLTSPTSGGVSA